ncbi:6-phosphogluconolactonase [Roseovarius aestuariivivens]|uniref:6-phosphogluconolactonase n=1 Tax=Roseovarius aestuariivivens TaxID=1888910 RepID=UPI00108050EF|nr:6-phosphogluconolactonase [Roseovarius aestuariivivens]
MRLIEYADDEMMAMDLANALAEDLTSALDHEDRALLCVAGGSTPGPVYDDLCDADLDWSRVDVMLSDERWVPEDHARSNTAMIRTRLLTGRASAATFLPLYMAAKTPEPVLAELETNILPRLPIAVLLLGMGADGHTASLFPGADRLEEALAPRARVLVPMRVPGQEDIRLTVSARVLNGAMAKHIVLTGSEKRAVLDHAKGADPSEAPVAALLGDALVHWAP